jgi:23S rRNA pseudouridine2605 synthase/23S rRNA pseudouridine2604 synthase
MEPMRLQKFLSAAGVCSRRKGEELIAAGAVTVNGKPVDGPGLKVDPSKDVILVHGVRVTVSDHLVYIALNKPVDCECTCRKKNERIVTDLVDIPQRIYPVGRLDKDSEGLILLTNDGRVHHTLSHPSFEHEKEYVVTVRRRPSDRDLKTMAAGMTLSEYTTRPCRIRRISDNTFSIVLKEGKNRQIRRMVEAIGNEVVRLKRIRISHIRLDRLKTGKWRYLLPDEVVELMAILDRAPRQYNNGK